MDDAAYERWVATLQIEGDEAYLPGEHHEMSEEKRQYHREWRQRQRQKPGFREHELQLQRQAYARKRAKLGKTVKPQIHPLRVPR